MMKLILEELVSGFPDPQEMATLTIRLVFAMVLGAVVGIQRERSGKPAGVRTHMLVALGGALVVIACLEFGINRDAMARVIQGLVTGIGFLGGGAILKLQEKEAVEGLTTAAGIWLTATVGIAVGLGREGVAVIGTILAWITLALVAKAERRTGKHVSEDKVAEK